MLIAWSCHCHTGWPDCDLICHSILTGLIAACCLSQVSLQKLTLSSNKLSAPEPILQRHPTELLRIPITFIPFFTFRTFGDHQDVLLKCTAVMDVEFSSQSRRVLHGIAFEDSYCRFRGFGHLMTGDIKNQASQILTDARKLCMFNHFCEMWYSHFEAHACTPSSSWCKLVLHLPAILLLSPVTSLFCGHLQVHCH